MIAGTKFTNDGSSPRGRGKHYQTRRLRRRRRLIPARAGKTSPGPRNGATSGAHPRAGGENLRIAALAFRGHGSSPRGRGKLAERDGGGRGVGLIPARAGKTSGSQTRAGASRAHPRAGGENPGQMGAGIVGAGSSPRGRGKRYVSEDGLTNGRLIPARAGKTWNTGIRIVPSWAHPRAGGENEALAASDATDKGSSPRGRGKRAGKVGITLDAGLIPARAGKTRRARGFAGSVEAHPRAGGENTARAPTASLTAGSSPRGRGKLHALFARLGFCRLIPARAGKTS